MPLTATGFVDACPIKQSWIELRGKWEIKIKDIGEFSFRIYIYSMSIVDVDVLKA